MGKRKMRFEVDDRTSGMSANALECRGLNHPWLRQPIDPARRAELAPARQVERVMLCPRCRTRRYDVRQLPTYELVGRRYEYGEDYLVQREERGQGRLPSAAALLALDVREDALG